MMHDPVYSYKSVDDILHDCRMFEWSDERPREEVMNFAWRVAIKAATKASNNFMRSDIIGIVSEEMGCWSDYE